MLQLPSEWITHFGANLVTTYPPDLGARFRYYERVVPQPSFSAIVGRALQNDPLFRAQSFGEMARIVTREGEYGAFVSIDGEREGSRAMKFVGAVFLDEFATALDGIALVPQHFSTVEDRFVELLLSDEQGLTRRQRRFFYVPPPTWHGLPSGPTANWYPLDFPNNLTNIVVPPALAVDGDGARELEQAIAQCALGLAIEGTKRGELIANDVRGTHVYMHGLRAGRKESIHRELAAFVLNGVLYRMRLETTNVAKLDHLREVFRAVATSFRPLPSPEERRIGRPFVTTSNIFDHWVS